MKHIFVPLIILAVVASLAVPATALAGHWHANPDNPSQCQPRYRWGDMFHNYDFEHEIAWWDDVDWTTNMLFLDNADVEKVHRLYWGQAIWAAPMYMYLDENSDPFGAYWVTDWGTKEFWAVYLRHLRVYGAWDPGWSGDLWRFTSYSSEWGYYVVGTSHIDFAEGTPNAWSGWSEEAEGGLAAIAASKGKFVLEDWEWWNNYEPYRWETAPGQPDHWWLNEGHTTYVGVD